MGTLFLSFYNFNPQPISFWPFTPFLAQKIKIFEKWKTWLEILSFFTNVPKITTISCVVPQIELLQDFWIFWVIFALLLYFLTQKIKILKKWKNAWRCFIIWHTRTKNHDHMMYSSWDTASKRHQTSVTDGRTEK